MPLHFARSTAFDAHGHLKPETIPNNIGTGTCLNRRAEAATQRPLRDPTQNHTDHRISKYHAWQEGAQRLYKWLDASKREWSGKW